jgi:hypothetical protein
LDFALRGARPASEGFGMGGEKPPVDDGYGTGINWNYIKLEILRVRLIPDMRY